MLEPKREVWILAQLPCIGLCLHRGNLSLLGKIEGRVYGLNYFKKIIKLQLGVSDI